jgi:hypothetical protein
MRPRWHRPPSRDVTVSMMLESDYDRHNQSLQLLVALILLAATLLRIVGD